MGRESWGGDTLETMLIESHQAITGYAAGLVGHDEAEDIAQDVAVKALEASSKRGFSSEAHFQNWLFRVTRNRCVSVLRKKVNFGFPISEEETLDFEAGPEEQHLSKEGLEELAVKLERLTPKQKEVLSLRYLQDLEFARIAAILGISEGTARKRNYQGLEVFRRNLLQDEQLLQIVYPEL